MIISCNKPNPSNQLIPVQVKGKTGFISSSGSIIVPPKFFEVGELSEGLIAVREHGKFGYINTHGQYSIEPQFDFACEFKEGLALVYKNEIPYYINQKGEIPFNVNFSYLGSFSQGRAIVKTESKKYGVINNKGILIIDTIFSKMSEYVNGLSIVEGLQHNPYDEDDEKICYETGVIDSVGHFVIPLGNYSLIENWHEGYFKVTNLYERDHFDNPIDALIDRHGKTILKETQHRTFSFYHPVSCGLVDVFLPKIEKLVDGEYSGSSDHYIGFINMKGKLMNKDKKIATANPFSENRAFVSYDYTNYFIIDNLGKRVGKDSYQEIKEDGFKNGIALVKSNEKWGIIDCNANWITKPIYYYLERLSNDSRYISFALENETDEKNKFVKWGILNKDGKIIKDTFADIINAFIDSGNYFICGVDSFTKYLDEHFKCFWQQKIGEELPDITQMTFLNTAYKGRANCYAYSLPDGSRSRGWSVSKNTPRAIDINKTACNANNLCLYVNKDCSDTINKILWARSLYLMNHSKDSIQFEAQDSRLYICLQAKTEKNEWKDIEYFPSSFCGNSYHSIWLRSGYYWVFQVPCCEGDIKTQLRYRLIHLDPMDRSIYSWEKDPIEIYSNEFEGSVNPGQFWNKGIYRNMGIMDPYFD